MGRKVFGIGINDVVGITQSKGYTSWNSMIRRCYSNVYHSLKPTYKKYNVEDSWKTLSNYLPWFEDNYVEGFELDKDLLDNPNLVYSETTCCFLPKEINSFFIKQKPLLHKGLPVGVLYNKKLDSFVAACSAGKGKSSHIMVSKSVEECESAYKKVKTEKLHKIIVKYKYNIKPKIYSVLENYKF